MADIKPPKVFISYAWEDDLKTWALEFATRLRSDGINAILDQWETMPGDQLPEFMERSVRDSDFVVFVCTPTYKKKSNGRKGGVGYEGSIITGEVFQKNNHRKFIPVLQKGKWALASPSWATAKLFIDFRGDPYSETSYQQLLNTLFGKTPTPPPVRDDTLREKLEKEVAEKALLEAEDLVRQKSAKEKTEQEVTEKARQKEEERQKIAKEKADGEAVEKARLIADLLYEKTNQAINLENSGSLDAALKVYYEIRFVDPQYPNIEKKIQEIENTIRLREKAEKKAAEKERLKAEQEERQRIAREKAERESAEKAEREKIAKEILEKVEHQTAEKAARDKETTEKARLEAEKQENFKIDETYTKIKSWIAYGGAISIGLFCGVLLMLAIAIPAAHQIDLFSLSLDNLFIIFFCALAGVWLVLTRRRLAFFLSFIVWLFLVFLGVSIMDKGAPPFNIFLSTFFIFGFFGLVIAFFLLKISVTKKLFSKILLCCAVCIILLFVVFLGSDAMLGFFGTPLESIYGFLPYVFVYFLFCSFFGNWLRRVLKNVLPNLFVEN